MKAQPLGSALPLDQKPAKKFKWRRFPSKLLRFILGYLKFSITGSPPKLAHVSLTYLTSITNGRFNDVVSRLIGLRHPPRKFEEVRGVLGTLNRARIREIVEHLDQSGYHVFDTLLSPALCDRLTEYALATPCLPMLRPPQDDLVYSEQIQGKPCLYDRGNIVSPRYDFDPQAVAESAVVQQLITDPGLVAIAEAYLRAAAISDMNLLWWSTAQLGGQSSSAAAQFYHCDHDRIRFLKFFVYLTDVDATTGPHCFVAGSHRRKPHALLRGSKRISDEEIKQYYPERDLLEIIGPRGTIIAIDNAGFHKGKAPSQGERLILQLLYENSRFGTVYPKVNINEKFSAGFLAAAKEHPRLFQSFIR